MSHDFMFYEQGYLKLFTVKMCEPRSLSKDSVRLAPPVTSAVLGVGKHVSMVLRKHHKLGNFGSL